jgi:hypothetical protein
MIGKKGVSNMPNVKQHQRVLSESRPSLDTLNNLMYSIITLKTLKNKTTNNKTRNKLNEIIIIIQDIYDETAKNRYRC